MNRDWRLFRPAIWLAMVGVALMLLIAPYYIGVLVLGFAIGVAIRIDQRRRRLAAPRATKTLTRKRRR